MECCEGLFGVTCTGCLPGKVMAAKGQELGSFMPNYCGCKVCYCQHYCTGFNCGYVTLVSAKAKATTALAAIALIAARNVESEGPMQILLALFMFLTMVTIILVAVDLRRAVPAGSLKEPLNEPLVDDRTDDAPDA